MGIRLLSFVTTKCPLCRFRYGHRAANHGSRLLGFVGIHALECRSCNLRFWAFLSARARRSAPMTGVCVKPKAWSHDHRGSARDLFTCGSLPPHLVLPPDFISLGPCLKKPCKVQDLCKTVEILLQERKMTLPEPGQ